MLRRAMYLGLPMDILCNGDLSLERGVNLIPQSSSFPFVVPPVNIEVPPCSVFRITEFYKTRKRW